MSEKKIKAAPHKFARKSAIIILRLLGWEVVGSAPSEPKYVMIGYPHTSNWDVFYGLLIFTALGVRLQWVGKHTLFSGPFGRLIRKLGGIPVNRSRSQNFVQTVIDLFDKMERLVLVLSPEATRNKSNFWRSGFYHIASGAHVPVALAFLDYKNKTGGFGPKFYPSGDMDKDIQICRDFFKGISGKKAQNAGLIEWKDTGK